MSEPNDLSPRDARLMSQLTREAREAPLPDIDFDRLEAALMAKVEQAPARPRRTLWYAVGGLLASGGMGSVYRARQHGLDRDIFAPLARYSPGAKNSTGSPRWAWAIDGALKSS